MKLSILIMEIIMLKCEINNCNVSLNINSFSNKLTISNCYNIKNGKLQINKFYGDVLADQKVVIRLCEEGDRVDYNFSSISKNREKYVIDVKYNV